MRDVRRVTPCDRGNPACHGHWDRGEPGFRRALAGARDDPTPTDSCAVRTEQTTEGGPSGWIRLSCLFQSETALAWSMHPGLIGWPV